jgi:hypothetical protein
MVFSESTTTNMARKQNVFFNDVATMCGAAKDILMFLDQNDLVSLTLVSKEFHNIIQNRIVPVYEISPRLYGSAYSLISKLCFNSLYKETKFRRYHHIKIDEYLEDIDEEINSISMRKLELITNDIRINWVTSLDMSLPNDDDDDDDDVDNIEEEKGRRTFHCIPIIITRLFPNLKELNISNIIFDASLSIDYYSIMFSYSSYLKTIIWNHSKNNICISGINFRNHASSKKDNHLKEIILDDSVFIATTTFLSEATSDLPHHKSKFIFFECSSTESSQLERLSIRNAYYCCNGDGDGDELKDRQRHRYYPHHQQYRQLEKLPQNALIKFVRNAPPSLRWFRSDLSLENMVMLRNVRPEIELLN